jgi:hypothetical protein
MAARRTESLNYATSSAPLPPVTLPPVSASYTASVM